MAVTGKGASIEDALFTHLALLVTTPATLVAWPDLPFAPDIAAPYLEPFVLPNQTDLAGLGTGAARRHFGLLQVTVRAGEGTGAATTSQIADQIIEHFAPDTVISANSIRVRIGAFNGGPAVPYRSQGFNENGYRVVPVTIPYWCDIF